MLISTGAFNPVSEVQANSYPHRGSKAGWSLSPGFCSVKAQWNKFTLGRHP